MAEQSISESIRLAILKTLDGARIGVGTGERRDSMDPEQVAAIVLYELRPALLHHKETAKELAQIRAGADALAQTLVAAHQESAWLAGEVEGLKKEIARMFDTEEVRQAVESTAEDFGLECHWADFADAVVDRLEGGGNGE